MYKLSRYWVAGRLSYGMKLTGVRITYWFYKTLID